MLKIVFAGLIIVHGLIHLMGFVKAFKLAAMDKLTHSISKPSGLLWLAAALLFILTAIIYMLKYDWWWILSVPAILLSQVLIILYWQDAGFGTIANLIILIVTVLGFGTWNFNSMVKNELKSFIVSAPAERKVVTADMLLNMPGVVQRWLQRSNIVGKEMVYSVHLKQQGELRTTPAGKWMPVKAEQWFRTENPGFIWSARVEAVPGIYLAGRDKYEHGKGHMLIKLLSLFSVADVSGFTIDQGAMLRYLAEIFWFPPAALSNYLRWEQIDSMTVKVFMNYGGISDSGLLKFDASGDVVSFETRRYYDRKEGATLEDWFIQVESDGYREFNGVRIPAVSTVIWKLKEGDFPCFKAEITDIKYNMMIK